MVMLHEYSFIQKLCYLLRKGLSELNLLNAFNLPSNFWGNFILNFKSMLVKSYSYNIYKYIPFFLLSQRIEIVINFRVFLIHYIKLNTSKLITHPNKHSKISLQFFCMFLTEVWLYIVFPKSINS